MDDLRRGSMEHVKGRVGSFWGQSAISAKERGRIFSIKSRDSNLDADNSILQKITPREDDSFLDF